MGKKKQRKKNKDRSSKKVSIEKEEQDTKNIEAFMKNAKKDMPFVSVCTTTYNMRPLFKILIKCFESQTYPKENIEWIILDQGSDNIKDLLEGISNVRYYQSNKKLPIGQARNYVNQHAVGDIIVYMDEDVFYPPERVQHSVEKLTENESVLCAGCSETNIYYSHLKRIVQFGPYLINHGAASSFAFKKKLLDETSFQNKCIYGEEKHFLKNYTIPFVQLDTLKTFLVFCHNNANYNRTKHLENIKHEYVKISDKAIKSFVKDKQLQTFYDKQLQEVFNEYKEKIEFDEKIFKQISKIQNEIRNDLYTLSKYEINNKQIIVENQESRLSITTTKKLTQLYEKQKEVVNKFIKKIKEKDNLIEILQQKLEEKKEIESIKININEIDVEAEISKQINSFN